MLNYRKILPVLTAFTGFGLGYSINEQFEAKKWRNKFCNLQEESVKYNKIVNEVHKELEDKTKQMSFLDKIENCVGCPEWIKDWDGRNEKRPNVNRIIILIRHGQYFDNEENEDEKKLTSLGKEQCRLVGKQLKEYGFKYSRLISSTMIRARESAELISKELDDMPIIYDSLLEEGKPSHRIPGSKKKFKKEEHGEEAKRIYDAWKKYCRRAEVKSEEPEIDIIVCHCNVIRSFVCRTLQIPVESWLRFRGDNANIAILKVYKNGNTQLLKYGETGHIPPKKTTFSLRKKSDFLNCPY